MIINSKLVVMKNIIYIVFLLSIVLCPFEGSGMVREKKDTGKNKNSAYQKLFDGKSVKTAKGVMTIHYAGGNVYVEFPLDLLGKDMLFASSIENTSDNGEGVVGQFAGTPQVFVFTKEGNHVQARLRQGAPVGNGSGDANMESALEKSFMPGVYATFKIETYTPDNRAVVLNMTSFFLEHTAFTNPFSVQAANSVWGFVGRNQKYKANRNLFQEVKADGRSVTVVCESGYDVDHIVVGSVTRQNIKVSVTFNKMLVVLPEDKMTPRYADSRIGVSFVTIPEIGKEKSILTKKHLARRWRVEPSDEVAYWAGQVVEPKKPIVFYLDTLMPESWTKYVRAGIEEWNKAFERIGFKNVLRAVPFPGTSDFDAGNIQHSVIRYSPTSPNMYRPQQSMLVDNRSGEILNASLYLHHHFLFILHRDRLLYTMAADPEARKAVLSEEVMGQLIKSQMIREIGSCLGLRSNLRASSVYPVDSLRSATFTREHGLSPSIMDMVPYNYVAQEEDVKNGVMLVQDKLGEYDYYAIEWLYKPIRGVKNADEERDTLDRWIKESRLDIAKTYGHTPFTSNVYDPRILSEDLGNDHVKAGEYLIKNLKKSMAHCREWFAEEDKTLELQNKLYVFIQGRYMDGLNRIASYIGGMYINEGNSDENVQHYAVVPKAKQREAINFLLAQAKDLEWLDNQELRHDLRVSSSAVQQKRMDIFGLLFSRWYMVIMSSRKASGGYTADEYMDELYRMVWEGTIKRRKLDPLERDFQMAFLAAVIASSTVTEDAAKLDAHTKALAQGISSGRQVYDPILCEKMERMQVENISGFYAQEGIKVNTLSRSHVFYQMLLKIDGMVNNAMKTSTGEMKDYYEYLHYKIRQALDVEGIR